MASLAKCHGRPTTRVNNVRAGRHPAEQTMTHGAYRRYPIGLAR